VKEKAASLFGVYNANGVYRRWRLCSAQAWLVKNVFYASTNILVGGRNGAALLLAKTNLL